ncbi:MAG: hypothetical protein QOH81_3290 [Sphingomonadales bacterium]|jgi:hypothetical protein|nr:hypothetical protein [Sphingomonadales bacterium]
MPAGRLRPLAFALLPFAAAGCRTPDPQPLVVIRAVPPGETCRFEVEGRAFTIQELLAAAAAWHGRPVRLNPLESTPFKCLGAAIYGLERAGTGRVDFIFEPPLPSPRK